MVKLFVGGFPLDIEELELAKIVAVYGDISTLKIVRDKKTRVCKGYAFIEMVDRAGAEAAMEALDGTSFAGKVLSVKITEEPAVTRPKPGNFRPAPNRPPRPTGSDDRQRRPRRTIN
ncbi:RNA-binding protein [Mucilaginibacter terrenus]|uniref:RNA-binding protein n=1 Tax=Mucilaginibacter terrenus TaxID=2482727 RepID=A0A3E2NT90_9SPHI|nr:RNA-binding protein [Mucilaginibacter terrenus]RFZ84141.1 RNA-binding protein [Mucilaginibacter terrenus]